MSSSESTEARTITLPEGAETVYLSIFINDAEAYERAKLDHPDGKETYGQPTKRFDSGEYFQRRTWSVPQRGGVQITIYGPERTVRVVAEAVA